MQLSPDIPFESMFMLTYVPLLLHFNFRINKYGLGEVLELISDIIRLPVNTLLIKEHTFFEGETPFLKM